MKSFAVISCSLIAIASVAGSIAIGQEDIASRPLAENYDPGDLVGARRALKSQIYAMRQDIEAGVEDGASEQLDRYLQDLLVIAAALEVFPYLFPASSSPDALAAAGSDVTTDAAEVIWKDFPSFFERNKEVAALARNAAAADSPEAFAQASANVWDGCTDCHDDYLNYEMSLDFGGESDIDLDALGF